MRFLKALILFLATALLTVTMLYAKADYTKSTGKPCAHCHVKTGSKDLNDVGKCYAKNHKLDDCKAPEKK